MIISYLKDTLISKKHKQHLLLIQAFFFRVRTGTSPVPTKHITLNLDFQHPL